MTRCGRATSTLLLTLVPVCVAGADADADAELPVYVGRTLCLECHGAAHAGDPCTVTRISEHTQAFETLATPEAEQIAALSGEPQAPQQSIICLGCHATGAEEGPRWTADTFSIADGVQCEACHGPGSGHVQRYRSPPFGAADADASLLRPVNRWICGTCHRELPSHKMVAEQGFRRAADDHLYKTPVNLVIAPDSQTLYVVCQRRNSLLIVNAESGAVLKEVEVGLRPTDAALSPDGARLYVSNRLSDSVSVIDTVAQKVVAQIPVGDEPHGLLTDATGRRLFVLNTDENSISVIDLRAQIEVTRLAAGRGPWSLAPSPDGRSIYVTSVRPDLTRFRQPHASEITVIDPAAGVVSRRLLVPEANMLKGIDLVPAGPHRGTVLFVMMRCKNLVPLTRLAQGWLMSNGLGVIAPNGDVAQILLDQPAGFFPDPNDVAVSPDGRHALVTSGGADEVAVVDLNKLLETINAASPEERKDTLPNHLGLSGRFVIKRLSVGGNPRGVAFSPDGARAYVANALDDSVTVIDTAGFVVRGVIDLGGPDGITELRRGEKLFHSANISFGRQFSCQSCHPDGHVNGLTIDIEAEGVGTKPVDNRTLRGLLDTAPYKWSGTNPTLFRQCGPRLAVFLTRLAPFTPDELQALVRYECTIERPPNRYRPADGLTPAQYRGKLVFDRTADNRGIPIPPEDQCLTCHNGPYKTAQTKTVTKTTMWFDAPTNMPFDPDNMYNAREYGDLGTYFFAETKVTAIRLDVPHLSNLYDSAPYLHNGSAHTLEQIWTRFAMLEGHGLTGDLTRRQFNDLIAYLKGL